MKTKIREQTLWLFALLGAILCMGVGYASINSITGEITGDLVAKVQKGVFITNVEYVSDVNANLDTSKINKYVGTLMQSTVELSKNPKSEITYKVTFYNNSEELNAFINVIYDEEFYDNLNIIFEISGFNYGETIEPGEIKETYITFKYKDGVIPEIKVLNSYLNFKMAKFVLASEIFDRDGTNPDGLHIGDFVDYDAGTWTQGEIQALRDAGNNVSGSTELPTGDFQFGGFAAGGSRNGNATPNSDPLNDGNNFDYVKDASTGEAIEGWRVFDIEEDGRVILISAGCPEDYYHPYKPDKGYAYESEYILTGNINSKWTDGEMESANYTKRSWNNYVNIEQKAESATVLSKSRLDSWYSKYIVAGADPYDKAIFKKIYDKEQPYIKYQNVIENYTYYYLAQAWDTDAADLHEIDPNLRHLSATYGNRAFGVRPLVTLKSDVKFMATKIGTKTVTGGNTTEFGGDQTYNVWKIEKPER